MNGAAIRRGLLIALPFVLLGVGFWRLLRSPWPAIWRLMLKGAHVKVIATWSTYGELALIGACFVTALVISFNIRRRD